MDPQVEDIGVWLPPVVLILLFFLIVLLVILYRRRHAYMIIAPTSEPHPGPQPSLASGTYVAPVLFEVSPALSSSEQPIMCHIEFSAPNPSESPSQVLDFMWTQSLILQEGMYDISVCHNNGVVISRQIVVTPGPEVWPSTGPGIYPSSLTVELGSSHSDAYFEVEFNQPQRPVEHAARELKLKEPGIYDMNITAWCIRDGQRVTGPPLPLRYEILGKITDIPVITPCSGDVIAQRTCVSIGGKIPEGCHIYYDVSYFAAVWSLSATMQPRHRYMGPFTLAATLGKSIAVVAAVLRREADSTEGPVVWAHYTVVPSYIEEEASTKSPRKMIIPAISHQLPTTNVLVVPPLPPLPPLPLQTRDVEVTIMEGTNRGRAPTPPLPPETAKLLPKPRVVLQCDDVVVHLVDPRTYSNDTSRIQCIASGPTTQYTGRGPLRITESTSIHVSLTGSTSSACWVVSRNLQDTRKVCHTAASDTDPTLLPRIRIETSARTVQLSIVDIDALRKEFSDVRTFYALQRTAHDAPPVFPEGSLPTTATSGTLLAEYLGGNVDLVGPIFVLSAVHYGRAAKDTALLMRSDVFEWKANMSASL